MYHWQVHWSKDFHCVEPQFVHLQKVLKNTEPSRLWEEGKRWPRSAGIQPHVVVLAASITQRPTPGLQVLDTNSWPKSSFGSPARLRGAHGRERGKRAEANSVDYEEGKERIFCPGVSGRAETC